MTDLRAALQAALGAGYAIERELGGGGMSRFFVATDALAYAHRQEVVHRDIKPENVLLSAGHAMVTDFGVAKAIESARASGTGLTATGLAIGTPSYMAPEQASGDPSTDHRADIYAFGALAFELLTGTPPFTGRTAADVVRAHLTEPAPSLAQRRDTVPPHLDAMVARCLAKGRSTAIGRRTRGVARRHRRHAGRGGHDGIHAGQRDAPRDARRRCGRRGGRGGGDRGAACLASTSAGSAIAAAGGGATVRERHGGPPLRRPREHDGRLGAGCAHPRRRAGRGRLSRRARHHAGGRRR
jgi:hypothetical protein